MKKLLWGLLLVPAILFAQSFTASVRGIVRDPSQAAVPAAEVKITEVNRNLNYTTNSDAEGRYSLLAIPPGTYTMTVTAPGFRTYQQAAFALEVQQQATVNVDLAVGDVTTALEVTASAPLLNTVAATLGQVVENKFIQTTPLQSRNPLTLVMLAPGLVPADNSAGGSSNTNFVANGVRANTSDVMLDGINISGIEQNGGVTEVKYQPSVDVIEEFKVQTNMYGAEFGNSGGAVVNMITKSGTNEVHGTVYEFHRNAALNANSFFSNRQGRDLPDFSRNVFGGTIGGPLAIPKVYDGKNRTFFFFDFEGSRESNATETTGTVPSDLQRSGDFSQTFNSNGSQAVIYNPFDLYYDEAKQKTLRRPFAGNVIPLDMQNRVGQNIVRYYPGATSEGNRYTHANNFFAQGVNKNIGNQMDFKVDHTISEKQRFSSRYSVNWGHNDPVNLFGNEAVRTNVGPGRTQSFVFDYTRAHTPTMILTARAGIMRVKAVRDPSSTGFDQTSLGFPDYMLTQGVKQFPDIGASGYLTIGASSWGLIHRFEDIGTINGSVTKIAGAHTIKLGTEVRHLRENYYMPAYPAGNYSFNRAQTGQNPATSSSSQGDAIASMLLGWGSGGNYGIEGATATSTDYIAFYGQDDWRITSKLTLNLGLRYDFETPRTERFNRLNWFDFGAPSPIASQVPEFPNLKGVMRFADDNHRSPFDGDFNNFQPRIGLAYAVGDKMSVRAGYGIYYVSSRHGVSGEMGSGWRSRVGMQFTRDGGYTRYASLDNPYPDGVVLPPGRNPLAYLGLTFETYGPTDINPQYQQWNFSIQRELPGSSVFEVNYAGSKGTHLYFGSSGDSMSNVNKLPPEYYALGRGKESGGLNEMVPNPFYGVITDPRSIYSQPTVTRVTLLRPYPQVPGSVGNPMTPNIANSSYHSVQFKYEKRFSHGLGMLAHYTISKMMSDSDVNNSEVNYVGGNSGVQNIYNLRLERSVAVMDIPQRAVITFNYQLPFGKGRTFGNNMNKVLNGVVGGWEFSGIMTFSSGVPIVPGLSNGQLWDATQRPNLIGDPSTSGDPASRLNNYFNKSAFSQPAPDTLGTAPRTLNYRAFGIRNGDFTMMKNFFLTERQYFQLRAESFNITNTPTFGIPDSSFGSSTFGVISGYANGRGPRQHQLALKFYY